MNNSQNILTAASSQWATRPDDQRFLTLDDLRNSVENRKNESWTCATPVSNLRAVPDEETNQIAVQMYDPNIGERRLVKPTHWAFGQLAMYAGAPAAYLRRLPSALSAINLQWGLEHLQIREDSLVLGRTNGDQEMRAMTSTSYGRIWDINVVKAVQRVNADGRWQIPSSSYTTRNPKRATTLYASDRDVYIFLVDPENPVELGNEKLFRGFFIWNSEVGACTFGLTTFLYRYVCDNRIVWGATEVRELRIRHTGGAPERFASEGRTYLKRYAEESTYQTVETIKKAQAFELPKHEEKDGGWESWLRSRGFTGVQAKQAVATAKAEEGEARSLWDIVNGVTAYARQIPYTDERIKLETLGGNLLNRVAS